MLVLLRARVLVRRVPVVMLVVPPAARPPATLQIALHGLDPGPVPAHDIPNIADAVKVLLEFVDLPQYLVEARNLCVGGLDQAVRAGELGLGEHGALLAQVLDAALHLAHEAVEVPRQLRQRGAVEEEHALAGGPAGGAGRARAVAESRLALAQQLDFLRRQAELRVGHALRRGAGHHGLPGGAPEGVAARDWRGPWGRGGAGRGRPGSESGAGLSVVEDGENPAGAQYAASPGTRAVIYFEAGGRTGDAIDYSAAAIPKLGAPEC